MVKPISCWCPALDRSWLHPILTAATPATAEHGVAYTWSVTCPRDAEAEAMFVHSRPLPTWGRPAVLHIEEARSLFWGKVEGGSNPALSPEILAAARAELSQYSFILTHLRHTAATLCDVLGAPELSGRIVHCPLGIEPPQGTSPKPGDKTRFLFTNSFHNDPVNLKRRGLSEALAAFREIHARHPAGVELVVVAPGVPAPVALPGVQWIDRRLSAAGMDELFASSHALLLPAIDLHAHSVARAQANGCIPIVSDAPGFEEFVADGLDGLVVPGWRGEGFSWVDDAGLHRSAASFDHKVGQEQRVTALAGAMNRVLRQPIDVDAMAVDALAKHDVGRWRQVIANAVRFAVAGEQEAGAAA